MNQPVAYRWQPIEDLPNDYMRYADPQLRSLASVWEEHRAEMQASDSLTAFNEQLLRRWAIETGIIERIYTLDRGITQLLIERGLDTALVPHSATNKHPELVMRIIRDQYEAVEGLFDFVAQRRRLSTSYIKELHALLTAHQPSTEAMNTLGQIVEVPLLRGEYKTRPNNPLRPDGELHEYCPPEQVASEMDQLVALHQEHLDQDVPAEIEAAWLHHRFTQIHPFQDGNGRVARALATLIIIQKGWLPLVITNDDRADYIAALELADARDLGPLVALFAKIQRKAFVQALSVARDVLDRERQVHNIVAVIRDSLLKRQGNLKVEWDRAKTLAGVLRVESMDRFREIALDLESNLAPLAPDHATYTFYADSEPGNGERKFWFRYQVIQTARQVGYFANTSVHHSWTRLVLNMESKAEILISFHGIGHEFRGLLVCSACFYRRDATEQKEGNISEVIPLTDELFSINYRENEPEVRERYRRWLDAIVVTGLEMWRKSL